jgi:hypothetical protein
VCEQSGDGIEQFDLSTKTDEIKNGQTNVTVTYYESEANAIVLTTLPTYTAIRLVLTRDMD